MLPLPVLLVPVLVDPEEEVFEEEPVVLPLPVLLVPVLVDPEEEALEEEPAA